MMENLEQATAQAGLAGRPSVQQGHALDQVHEIVLSGCSPIPLANYLKALGILRLVAEQADPGDDLIGTLVREHGDELTADELVGVGGLLLLAGHETTSNMLALGTLALLRHPEQLEFLRKEPSRIDAAIEELLRWLSIVHSGTLKLTSTEVEIAGQRIGPGELVVCALPAGNRDPELIDDPDRLDLSRGEPGHLAFGHGVHHCLGAPLARMEMRIALPALLERFPGLREAEPAPGFRPQAIVYGLTSMHVAW